MEIHIDPNAGFCFGVRRAIQMAEEHLAHTAHLYCLGQVVHNEEEETRLKKMGLDVIDYQRYQNLQNSTVLIRAHGEPPKTYEIAKANNLTLIDGSCPIVLKLQTDIKKSSVKNDTIDGQVVILGKKNHPEVIGLTGQATENSIVIENEQDIRLIDFTKPISLFAQTTKSKKDFARIVKKIAGQLKVSDQGKEIQFSAKDSICKYVSDRDEGLKSFAKTHDVIIFVGGEHSSNGHQLFEVCKTVNGQSYYVGNAGAIKAEWFLKATSVGVSGATSTPQWLLKDVAGAIQAM
jgi:4-hydroxy-3-methylbut-2-enyl diphosphate reductase